MNLWQRGGSKLRQILIRTLYNWREIDRMRQHADPRIRAIAEAVSSASEREVSADESDWIFRIEKIRRHVYASQEVVTLDTPETATQAIEAHLGKTSRVASKGYPWCLLLFHLVRKLGPISCLELGTCVGISACFQAAALEINGRGRLCTLEGHAALAEVAGRHFAELGLDARSAITVGGFDDTLPGVLRESGPFGLVFVDGNHAEEPTWSYYRQILPYLDAGGVLVFDDIDWSRGMRRVWGRIRRDGDLAATIDLTKIGIAVVGPSVGKGPEQFTVAI